MCMRMCLTPFKPRFKILAGEFTHWAKKWGSWLHMERNLLQKCCNPYNMIHNPHNNMKQYIQIYINTDHIPEKYKAGGSTSCTPLNHPRHTFSGMGTVWGQHHQGWRRTNTGREGWEKDATHNSNARWLLDLRADHSNLPEQGPVTITVADVQASPVWRAGQRQTPTWFMPTG